MSVEMIIPFQLAPDGSIAVTTDPNRQAQQHVDALVSTNPGERVMLPGYGVPVRDSVFSPDDETAVNNLANEITEAFAKWEPNITIDAVDFQTTPGQPDGFCTIELDWSIKQIQNATSSGVLSATILIGGTVISSGIG